MARAQLEIPDELLERASKNKLRALQRENTKLTARVKTLEAELRNKNGQINGAKRTQAALREFIGVLKDEWDLEEKEYQW